MGQVKVTLERERETKRFVRYAAASDTAPVDTIYVRKSTLDELGNPRVLILTIDAA